MDSWIVADDLPCVDRRRCSAISRLKNRIHWSYPSAPRAGAYALRHAVRLENVRPLAPVRLDGEGERVAADVLHHDLAVGGNLRLSSRDLVVGRLCISRRAITHIIVHERGAANAEETALPHLESPEALLAQVALEVELDKQLLHFLLGHPLDVLRSEREDVLPVNDHLLEGGDVVRRVFEAEVVKERSFESCNEGVHPLVRGRRAGRVHNGGWRV